VLCLPFLAPVAANQRADVADHRPDREEDEQDRDQRSRGADEEDVEVGLLGVLKRDDDREGDQDPDRPCAPVDPFFLLRQSRLTSSASP
jgi:hypothetical protein